MLGSIIDNHLVTFRENQDVQHAERTSVTSLWMEKHMLHGLQQHGTCTSLQTVCHKVDVLQQAHKLATRQRKLQCLRSCAHVLLCLSSVRPPGPRTVQQARRCCSCQLPFLSRHVHAHKLVCLKKKAGATERVEFLEVTESKAELCLPHIHCTPVVDAKQSAPKLPRKLMMLLHRAHLKNPKDFFNMPTRWLR